MNPLHPSTPSASPVSADTAVHSGPIVLGIDLGGTSVKGVALTPSGEELGRTTTPFDLASPGAFARAVRETVGQLEHTVGRNADRIGLSAPGLAARDGRSIAYMPGRFDGLVGLDWATFLQRPAVPVLNDAHAALLGEVWLGAARGAKDVFLLTLGTGVGGAAMVDGRLLRGHGGKAGHLGHISLDPLGPPDVTRIPGSLEDALGNHNIATRTGGRFATTHDLVHAVEAGDPFARQVWQRSVNTLAAAIASLANVLDPEIVIVGGGIARCGETLFSPLREFARCYEWQVSAAPLQIVPAQLGELAGAVGAARNALD
jgi:glucokinase